MKIIPPIGDEPSASQLHRLDDKPQDELFVVYMRASGLRMVLNIQGLTTSS